MISYDLPSRAFCLKCVTYAFTSYLFIFLRLRCSHCWVHSWMRDGDRILSPDPLCPVCNLTSCPGHSVPRSNSLVLSRFQEKEYSPPSAPIVAQKGRGSYLTPQRVNSERPKSLMQLFTKTQLLASQYCPKYTHTHTHVLHTHTQTPKSP